MSMMDMSENAITYQQDEFENLTCEHLSFLSQPGWLHGKLNHGAIWWILFSKVIGGQYRIFLPG